MLRDAESSEVELYLIIVFRKGWARDSTPCERLL